MYDRARTLFLRIHFGRDARCCSLRTESRDPENIYVLTGGGELETGRERKRESERGEQGNGKRPSIDVRARDAEKFIRAAREIYKRDLASRKT